MSTKFETSYVRVLYAHLNEPFKYQGAEKAKYDVTVLIKKDDEKTINAIAKAIESDKLKAGTVMDLLIDCDADADLSKREECQGFYKLTLKSNFKPKVYELRTGGELTDKNAYNGEYIKVQGTVYEYTFARKKGISVNLKNVLLSGQGEEFESTHPFDTALSKPFTDPDLPF